jgi:hypothetical protein
MTTEGEKYKKVLAILRRSKPELKGIDLIEDNVIGRIRKGEAKGNPIMEVIENMFAWIYIGWVRRSLVTASVLLVLFFVYQQTMILKGVNDINKREIVTGPGAFSGSYDDLGKQIRILKLTGRGMPTGGIKITEKQAEQLLDSFYELQDKYIDLIRIIEEDPVLKEYIEERLGKDKNKIPNL